MRIRWKLLILLLMIALIPLVVVTTFTWLRMRDLGEDIGRQSADTLVQNVEDDLLAFVGDRGALLQRELTIIRYVMRAQADIVQRCMAVEDPPESAVFFEEDFATMPADAPELTRSNRFMTRMADGSRVPLPHSLVHPVFVLAPGVKRQDVADDIQRLALVMPACRAFFDATDPRDEEEESFSLWRFTSLETGVHLCYPGHAGYAPEYDPRMRNWYREVKERVMGGEFAGRPLWSPPYVDATTGELVLSVALPIFRHERFVGVTAIDVTVAELLSYGSFARVPGSEAKVALWGMQTQIDDFMTRRNNDFESLTEEERQQLQADADQISMVVVAEPTDRAEDVRWEVPGGWTLLQSGDPAFDEMKRDLLRRESGVREIEYNGKRCLWGYGRIFPQVCLIAIVPYDEILAEAKAAERRVQVSTREQLVLSLIIFFVAVALVVVAALFGSRVVTQPMHRLVRAAIRIAQGDLSATVDVRSRDEIGELGQAFNDMIPKLQEHVQMEQSLSVAQEVQQSLLPSEPPTVPGFDVASRCIYCDETGGDYLDFIDLSGVKPNMLGVALGDVTGHGVGAALLMASGGALLRGGAEQIPGLDHLLDYLNKHLLRRGAGHRKFMTLSYVVLDHEPRTALWASAGHDPPILYDPSSKEFTELKGAGIPLGIDPDWTYEEYGPHSLSAGQVIVIGTDGIWEARNDQHDLFEKRRLRDVIAASHARTADQICEDITAAVVEFRAGHPQEDDITFIVVKVTE